MTKGGMEMAMMKEVEGYCVKEEWAMEVAALPYDVISTHAAKEIVKNKPYSFLRVDKPEISSQKQGEALYRQAAQQLGAMIAKGIYEKMQPCLYIYELRSKEAHQYGLVGLFSVEDYRKGIIKKHEKTRQDKEEGRMQHILQCRAHTGPIFLVADEGYRVGFYLKKAVEGQIPFIHLIGEDGVEHCIYRIEQESEKNGWIDRMQTIPYLYIADGHHRAAAAAKVAQKFPENEAAQWFLGVVFSKEQLHILGYHRLIKDESGLTKEMLFEKISQNFYIEEVKKEAYFPNRRHVLGMRYQRRWYQLVAKFSMGKELELSQKLDVTILQNNILAPLFGIEDPTTDPRIRFLPGSQLLYALKEEEEEVAFSLYPTSMEEVMRIADRGGLMPPKSTWFEPKLRSGFWIHCF